MCYNLGLSSTLVGFVEYLKAHPIDFFKMMLRSSEKFPFNRKGKTNIIENYRKTCRILEERKSNNKNNIAILFASVPDAVK